MHSQIQTRIESKTMVSIRLIGCRVNVTVIFLISLLLIFALGLASFTGMLFRRYSAELNPVLSYVAHQLQSGQTTEIVVLRELIWKMAGIEPLPSLSEAQIAAMAGGPTLRIEAIASETRGARLDTGESNLRGPQRLGRSLLEAPSLALPLLIQVAQQRQACVFRASDAHLKSLASLFDAVGYELTWATIHVIYVYTISRPMVYWSNILSYSHPLWPSRLVYMRQKYCPLWLN